METTQISVITDEIDPNKESDVETHEEHLVIPEGVEVYEINGPYFFGIATKFEEIMARLGDRPQIRIIRMRKVPFIDSTGIHNLTSAGARRIGTVGLLYFAGQGKHLQQHQRSTRCGTERARRKLMP